MLNDEQQEVFPNIESCSFIFPWVSLTLGSGRILDAALDPPGLWKIFKL
jgi:hypothetical protein